MSQEFKHCVDLAEEIEPPAEGILTRTLHSDDTLKATMFGFAQGEELSEHSAPVPAIVQFIRGEATMTLGDETVDATAGTWIHMAADLKHSLKANTPVTMLLLMLKKG